MQHRLRNQPGHHPRNPPRVRVPILVVALLLAVSACSSAHNRQTTAPGEAPARFQRIVDDLADPAMAGRGAGTLGLERARDYLALHLRELGLSPAFVDDQGEASFLQPFEIDLGAHVREQQLTLSTADAPEPVALQPERDFNALGFTGQGAFRGEAIFVGYGIVNDERHYDSFATQPGDEGDEDAAARSPLRGRVAIAFRFEPMDGAGRSRWTQDASPTRRWSPAASLTNKARWAAERGAVALLVVNPPAMQQGGPLRSTASTAFGSASIPVMQVDPAALRKILRAANRPPSQTLRNWQDNANRGVGRPEVLQGVTLGGAVALERPSAILHNVAGVVPGHGPLAEQMVIVGAHYDHLGYGEVGSRAHGEDRGSAIHPGADDNASGVAGLLGIAARAQGLAALQPQRDRRTLLVVAFSGEERGLLGSRHLVQNPGELATRLDDTSAMVNFDMIGRLRDTLHIFGTQTAAQWPALLDAASDNLPHAPALRSAGSGIGMSDHTSFYLRNIPVLHFFTGLHEDYHRPSDTPDKINAAGGVRVVRFAWQVVEQLLTQPQPLTFTAVEGDDAHGHAVLEGDGAYLGLMPDYATLDGGQGAGLADVTPGSPAARAGLQAGDRITAWDDEPIANVRTLTQKLSEANPGDTVRLTVRRAGETLTISATLGQRGSGE